MVVGGQILYRAQAQGGFLRHIRQEVVLPAYLSQLRCEKELQLQFGQCWYSHGYRYGLSTETAGYLVDDLKAKTPTALLEDEDFLNSLGLLPLSLMPLQEQLEIFLVILNSELESEYFRNPLRVEFTIEPEKLGLGD